MDIGDLSDTLTYLLLGKERGSKQLEKVTRVTDVRPFLRNQYDFCIPHQPPPRTMCAECACVHECTSVSPCGKAGVKPRSVQESMPMIVPPRVFPAAMLIAERVTCTLIGAPIPLLSAPYDLLFHHKFLLTVSLTFQRRGTNQSKCFRPLSQCLSDGFSVKCHGKGEKPRQTRGWQEQNLLQGNWNRSWSNFSSSCPTFASLFMFLFAKMQIFYTFVCFLFCLLFF